MNRDLHRGSNILVTGVLQYFHSSLIRNMQFDAIKKYLLGCCLMVWRIRFLPITIPALLSGPRQVEGETLDQGLETGRKERERTPLTDQGIRSGGEDTTLLERCRSHKTQPEMEDSNDSCRIWL
ncbi:hypothetical protein AVEN_216434-1 [Araneus ventricosus]|uniref:Uncharacterized protein n=1 Tax=Araneus ventricosus TaxID=182803 RepID=A0A4Y2BLE4_ARAVE|nr:hypothetical protein AVEN_216434-1 [Araneus ventricosus]